MSGRKAAVAPIHGLILGLIIAFVLQAVDGDLARVAGGELLGPDSYMRLERVRHLWATWAWFDPVYPRINPPEGMAFHWTRPMDALLLAGAVPLSLITDFNTALHWWAVALGPVMLLALFAALLWASRPLLDRGTLYLVPLLFVFQSPAAGQFRIGRPDHHGLILIVVILLLGAVFRFLSKPKAAAPAYLSGLLAGLGLWLGIQVILAVVITVAVPAVIWLFGDQRHVMVLRRQATALLITLLLALCIERGPFDLLAIEYDRLSGVHLFLGAFNLGFWVLVWGLTRSRSLVAHLPGRVLLAGLAGLIVIGCAKLQFPGLLTDPMRAIDPLLRDVILPRIKELQPILRFSGAHDVFTPAATRLFLDRMGMAAASLAYGVIWLFGFAGPRRRPLVFTLLVFASPYLLLSLFEYRWLAYPNLVLVIAYANLTGRALRRLLDWPLAARFQAVSRPLCIAAFALCFSALATLPRSGEGRDVPAGSAKTAVEEGPGCPLQAMAAHLAAPGKRGSVPKRLLTFIGYGPELLYRTPHSVYSITNHRAGRGFRIEYRVLGARDWQQARGLLARHGVEWILVCPHEPAAQRLYQDEDLPPSVFELLGRGENHPDFLIPLAVPEALSKSFRLYEVRF